MNQSPINSPPTPDDALIKKTVTELKKIAAQEEIDLDGLTKKDDIANAIRKHLVDALVAE
jgi:hypothetical protein